MATKKQQQQIEQLKDSEIQEGITAEMMQKCNFGDHMVIKENGDVVKLMECATGFWIHGKEFGQFETENGKRIILSEHQAKVMRCRYDIFNQNIEDITNEKIKEAKLNMLKKQEEKRIEMIKKEAERIEQEVHKKAFDTIHELGKVLFMAEMIDRDQCDFTIPMIVFTQRDRFFGEDFERQPEFIKAEKEKQWADIVAETKSLLSEGTKEYYFTLKRLLTEKDYDTLYIMLFSGGEPLVASYKTSDPQDMQAANKSFGLDSLEFVQNIQESDSHIYLVAMANVDKKMSNGSTC